MTGEAAKAAKYAAALAVIAEGRPLIWTDDDAIPAGDDRAALGDALLIEPRSRVGINGRGFRWRGPADPMPAGCSVGDGR